MTGKSAPMNARLAKFQSFSVSSDTPVTASGADSAARATSVSARKRRRWCENARPATPPTSAARPATVASATGAVSPRSEGRSDGWRYCQVSITSQTQAATSATAVDAAARRWLRGQLRTIAPSMPSPSADDLQRASERAGPERAAFVPEQWSRAGAGRALAPPRAISLVSSASFLGILLVVDALSRLIDPGAERA